MEQTIILSFRKNLVADTNLAILPISAKEDLATSSLLGSIFQDTPGYATSLPVGTRIGFKKRSDHFEEAFKVIGNFSYPAYDQPHTFEGIFIQTLIDLEKTYRKTFYLQKAARESEANGDFSYPNF